MNERKILLMEKYLNAECSSEEKTEFENLLMNDKQLQQEFEEQKNMKEVLSKMIFKDPPKEIWDNYRLNNYNKAERGIAWIAISIGVMILLGFAGYEAVNKFIADDQTPPFLKLGIVILVFGFLVLLFSVIKERIFLRKKDKYKEIIR